MAYSSQHGTNTTQSLLSPILNLPPSFGSAYVGQRFSCTLCATYDMASSQDAPAPTQSTTNKVIRDVRIEAEMKTPNQAQAVRLGMGLDAATADLNPGDTLQRIVDFDLKEEGNHVLLVTVSYYEATETSGRTRTFRKLYQFICKASLIVRTKVGALAATRDGKRRWVMEAQLENCSDEAIHLERVMLDLEPGLAYLDCNWEANHTPAANLQSGDVEQVAFIINEEGKDGQKTRSVGQDGRLVLGILGVGWRGEMGNRGFLTTGKLGTRLVE
jgi:hypothetical protein